MKAAVLLATLPLLAAATVSTPEQKELPVERIAADEQYEQPLEKRQSGCLAQCTGSVGCDALWGCVWEKCQVSIRSLWRSAVTAECELTSPRAPTGTTP